jgi:hypothetical protein
MLARAEIRRWPMYLRNVKQMVRQTNPSFDERAFGFASLADLLRAAHRDGSVRVERDRQGVIRVFQANGAGASTPTSAMPPAPLDVGGDELETSDEMTAAEEPLVVASAAATLGVPVSAARDESADSADAPESGDAAEAAPGAAPKRRRRTRGGGTARPRAKKTTRGS